MISRAVHSSARHTWTTPQCVIDALEPMGPIGLDPCSNPQSIVPARVRLSLETGDDGLAADWDSLIDVRREIVFVNPPYGRAIGAWVAKCIEQERRGVRIALLLPARTDTRWFQQVMLFAPQVAFWNGRLKFGGAPAPAPFPSAIFWLGCDWEFFSMALERYAIVMRTR